MARVLLGIVLFYCAATGAAEIYKYKDASGKWVFTDKKPLQKNAKFETINYKPPKSKYPQPKLLLQQEGAEYRLIAKNPLHAPLQMVVTSAVNESLPREFVAKANGETVLYRNQGPIGQFKYRWVLGDPEAFGDEAASYLFPVAAKQPHLITQSFNGRFSHYERPNKYAVDIAMQVGTDIQAARDGIVFGVKDDYHMGGAKKYFLDKANYISILHDDGSYADYAHILLGSAVVKPGQRVRAGDVIAQSGTSGYSTGPHLHFVVRRNKGGLSVSLPFEFRAANGQSVLPRRGMKIRGR